MKRFAEFKFQPILHVRSDLHLARKVWHMGMGMLIAFIYLAGLPTTPSVLILMTCFAVTLGVETARLRNPSFNKKMIRLFSPVMRSCEVNRITGIPYYLAASTVAIAVFPKPVAVLSILYLACGDPMASLAGILYGDRSIRFANGKSLIGTIAGILTCALVTFVFLSTMAVPAGSLLALTLLGGLAGGTAELLPVDADDNFTIPVISGFVMWLGFILLGL